MLSQTVSISSYLAFVISFGIYTIFALIISTYVSNISEFVNSEFSSEYKPSAIDHKVSPRITTYSLVLKSLLANIFVNNK